MAKFEIVERNEEDPAASKIVKSDFTTEITLKDNEDAHKSNKKGIEQIEAEVKIKKAIMTNIENNHPEIKDIDEKTQMMCHTYHEASRFIKFAEDKLEEFKKAQVDLEAEIADIKSQTGL
jgi:hypothetical protein